MNETITELVKAEVNRQLTDPASLRDIIVSIQNENAKQKALIETQKKIIESQAAVIEHGNDRIKAMTPAADFFHAVTKTGDWMDFRTAAKLLGHKKMGQNNLLHFLLEHEVLYIGRRRYPQRKWYEPFQEYVERGYFKVVERDYVMPDGKVEVSKKTVVSQRGLDFIRRLTREVEV